MARPKKSIQEQVEKLYPDFIEATAGLSVEDLELKLSTYAKSQEEIIVSQEEDTKLSDTKELLKELNAPYGDAKKAIRLKMRFIIAAIKDAGGK